jgi:hypothetical protein
VPPDPWDDVLDTLEMPPACPQPGEGVAYIESHVPGFNTTNEDCLYLNIYSPKVSTLYIMYIDCSIFEDSPFNIFLLKNGDLYWRVHCVGAIFHNSSLNNRVGVVFY